MACEGQPDGDCNVSNFPRLVRLDYVNVFVSTPYFLSTYLKKKLIKLGKKISLKVFSSSTLRKIYSYETKQKGEKKKSQS